LRYLGAKYRIKSQLIDFLLDYIQDTDCFVEPFCGSCNLTLDLFSSMTFWKPKNLILNDIHKDLMLMWQALIFEGWEPPENCTKEEYDTLSNAEPSALRGFVGHACAFGGRWFDTYAKNTDTRNYCLNGKNSVKKFKRVIENSGANVKIYNLSYEDVSIPDRSVVYCDPPYKDTAKPGFGNDFDHEKFWQWVRELSGRCQVFVSEYTAPEDFECVLEIDVELDMNREKRVERLFQYKRA